jgi:acetoin utilization deacetylase AcuC-like enzyme
MTTLLLNHPDCEKHVMLDHHPESPARLRQIHQRLDDSALLPQLVKEQASEIDSALFAGIHAPDYLAMLAELRPGEGIAQIDADTSLNKHSLRAARLAAGANTQAVEAVMSGRADNAFCAVRPPGHHAEAAIGMGFCIFNNVALAAERALHLGAERIAIVDFDVHHGNGTVDIFQDRPEVLVCSSFQYPFYPGRLDDVDRPNIVLNPLPEGTAGAGFRQSIEPSWSRAIRDHQPDLLLVSAGFDAHRDDPLGGLLLEDEDYLWVSQWLIDLAAEHCGGRLVSTLEGGYNVDALGRCVELHLEALLQTGNNKP